MISHDYTLYDSIRDVDIAAWNRLRRGERDPFMDPRFLLAVEKTMSETGHFRYVVFYDATKTPVASACLSSYRVDCTLLADGFAKTALVSLGRIAPFLVNFNVVFCGVPFSAGQSNVRIDPNAEPESILPELDRLLVEFALEERASAIVFKEFTAEECDRLRLLTELGYHRFDSMPMNHTDPRFDSFDDYCVSLRSRKRSTIRRSQKLFAKSELRVVQMTGADAADRIYTEDVHRLYEAVYDRATVRLEKLPPTLFPEMARQMPDNTAFTYIYEQDRVIAFAASVFTNEVFHQMFVGIDYTRKTQYDLYFNLFYQAIDYAFRRNVSDIFVGQSADMFKHRKLSCYQVPLYFLIKGVDRSTRFLLRHGHRALFPPRPLYSENGAQHRNSEPPAAKVST